METTYVIQYKVAGDWNWHNMRNADGVDHEIVQGNVAVAFFKDFERNQLNRTIGNYNTTGQYLPIIPIDCRLVWKEKTIRYFEYLKSKKS